GYVAQEGWQRLVLKQSHKLRKRCSRLVHRLMGAGGLWAGAGLGRSASRRSVGEGVYEGMGQGQGG
ncbi:hypothetical protein, partial [Spirosoma jeollabukense]